MNRIESGDSNKSMLDQLVNEAGRAVDHNIKAAKVARKELRKLEKAAQMAAVKAKALADGYEEIGEPKQQRFTAYAQAVDAAPAAPAPGPAAAPKKASEGSALVEKSLKEKMFNWFERIEQQ